MEMSKLVLVCLASLEQMHVELMHEHMEAHGGAGGSYEFCTKYGMTLRYDVSKGDQLSRATLKNT